MADQVAETWEAPEQGVSVAEVSMTVNGAARRATVAPRKTLADTLREDFGLTGTHLGCEHGVCGACTVLVDGAAVRSCLMFAVQADGADIVTVEGLTPPGGRDRADLCTAHCCSPARSRAARRAAAMMP